MHGYLKGKTLLNPDYRDILHIFSDEEVEYLLVGAYALAAHGYVRATGDIDLWIHANPLNAKRVIRALKVFGAPLAQVTEADFETPGIVFQIGVEPNRIDILTEISGVSDFKAAWDTRIEIELEGIRVPVLNRELLKQNKRSTGRPKDRADLAWLEGSE